MSYPDGKGGTFKPRTGKLAAQVAHASLKVFFDRADSFEKETLVIPVTPEMLKWCVGTFDKIVLGVETEADLLEAHRLATEAGLPTAIIQDLGHTEFHGVPTFTTCAIGPALDVEIDIITGRDGKIKTRLI